METLEKLKLHGIEVDIKAVGERIKQVRESLPGKPNQAEFYEILNDTEDTGKLANKWENGSLKNGPDLQNLARIAAVGDVSIEWLLTGKGKGISPTVGDSSPTIRDYCELLFVDMPRRFGWTWGVDSAEYKRSGDDVLGEEWISFSLPVFRDYGGPFDSFLNCAKRFNDISEWPSEIRVPAEKDLLSKVPAVPVPPLDELNDDSKPPLEPLDDDSKPL